MVSTMNFELASRFIQSDNYKFNQEKLAKELTYRQQAFKKVFDKNNIAARFGGLNIWLELPEHINMHQLNGLLLANKVKVRTADSFLSKGSSLNFNGIRISLGGPNSRALFDKGVNIMDSVFMQLQNNNDVVI
jgi:DNA-binding transcriptional MocR family regulator